MSRQPSLRIRLLFDLGYLMAAAVILVGLVTLLLVGGDLREAIWPLCAVWAGSIAVFAVFGSYLLRRLVLQPIELLIGEADSLAAGDFTVAPCVYETPEMTHLAERYRVLAEDLLDAQSHVVRVEKLASIGRLAAGVAHEVRNPLGALGTYTEVLRNRGVQADITDEMQRAIGRIELTVQSLLDYARPGTPTGRIDLRAAIESTVDFLGAQGLFNDHDLELAIADVPCLAGDRHAVEQVVLNLVVNACDAAPGARIWIGLHARPFEARHHAARRSGDNGSAELPLDRRFAARPRRPDILPGTPGVLLRVADDGPGVPDADRERVFDPFYTTKEPGKGAGLGLAIVARTVHELGGIVWVDRAREGGAAFKVFLPSAGSRENHAHPDH